MNANSLLFHLIFFFSLIVPETSPIINTFKNLSSTSVLLSWDPPVKPNGAIISYDLTLQGPNESYSFITSDNYIILEELSPFTLYSIFAAARTIKGLGPSSVLFFYTDESGKPEFIFLPMLCCCSPCSLFWKEPHGKWEDIWWSICDRFTTIHLLRLTCILFLT